MGGPWTADKDILRRRKLLVDLDPVRPAGVSSSDEEHAAAIQRAYRIADDMAREWDRPIVRTPATAAICCMTLTFRTTGRHYPLSPASSLNCTAAIQMTW